MVVHSRRSVFWMSHLDHKVKEDRLVHPFSVGFKVIISVPSFGAVICYILVWGRPVAKMRFIKFRRIGVGFTSVSTDVWLHRKKAF